MTHVNAAVIDVLAVEISSLLYNFSVYYLAVNFSLLLVHFSFE